MFQEVYKLIYAKVPGKCGVGFEVNIDMVFSKRIDGLDYSLFDEPVGIAEFDHKKGELVWDIPYTNNILKEFRELMSQYYRLLNLKGNCIF